jgi:uncharacterized protein HemX
MPFLPLILSFLGSCKVCRIVAIALAAAAALLLFIQVEKHKAAAGARAAVIAEQLKLTNQESQRREAVIAAAQRRADAAAANSVQLEKRNATLKADLARLSARVDGRACLDPDVMRRLRELGQPARR